MVLKKHFDNYKDINTKTVETIEKVMFDDDFMNEWVKLKIGHKN